MTPSDILHLDLALSSDATRNGATCAIVDAHRAAMRARLEAELLAMPPVVALGLRVSAFDGRSLRLSAPLSRNVNDKGCAFGGSMSSLMTLAGWALVTSVLVEAGLHAVDASAHGASLVETSMGEASLGDGDVDTVDGRGGPQCEVYVADSEIRYRAPLYSDLEAVATFAEGESTRTFLDTLRARRRARIAVVARIEMPGGQLAADSRSRYVAMTKA